MPCSQSMSSHERWGEASAAVRAFKAPGSVIHAPNAGFDARKGFKKTVHYTPLWNCCDDNTLHSLTWCLWTDPRRTQTPTVASWPAPHVGKQD